MLSKAEEAKEHLPLTHVTDYSKASPHILHLVFHSKMKDTPWLLEKLFEKRKSIEEMMSVFLSLKSFEIRNLKMID